MTVKTNSELKELLQIHFDTEYAGFIGYPISNAETKSFIEEALTAWIVGLENTGPASVDPKPIPVVSGAPSAFVAQLTLEIGGSISIFPTDMQGGWVSMMAAVGLPPSGNYTGSPTNPIISIVPLAGASGGAVIFSTIMAIMSTYNTGDEFCTALADAFTDAIALSGPTTCAYTIPGSPPGVGPLIFG